MLELTPYSLTLSDWLKTLSVEQKSEFIKDLFSVFGMPAESVDQQLNRLEAVLFKYGLRVYAEDESNGGMPDDESSSYNNYRSDVVDSYDPHGGVSELPTILD